MKWKTNIACLLISSLFAIPAWCDEPRDITEIIEIINVDFQKTDVKKVLKILVEPANLELVFDKCVQGKVTLKVENVQLNNLFKMVLEYAGLDYKQRGDKIRITCHDTRNQASALQRPRKFSVEEQVAVVKSLRRSKTNPEDLSAAREPLITYMETHTLDSVHEKMYLMLGQLWYFDEENENHIEEANKIFAAGSEMYPDNEELFLNYAITRHKLGYLETKSAEGGPPKSGDSAIVGMAHNLSEVDTPPRVLMAISPAYPIEAKADNIEGRVVLRFLVDTDGNAKEPEVVEFVPEEARIFVESAMETIKKYKFKPAMKNNEPVAYIVQMPLSFEME
ncbi:MAG: TonB family protein [Syntrophaceae bacterium]|nr:TonB family protein [Syntrophaceae bacterium]